MDVCVANNDLCWKQRDAWMDLPTFVAHHRIQTLPCNLLTCMLATMKVKGYSKLSHRLKAELFLKHLGWADAAIEAQLANLKVRTRKKKSDLEQNNEDDEQQEERCSVNKLYCKSFRDRCIKTNVYIYIYTF